ncbi:MAG TPA: hypothetical protein VG890_12940 [Puia sp.]|nr:hypothetical protein [Puia sp.]
MKKLPTILILTLTLASIRSNSQELSKDAEKALKAAFGVDINDYKIYSYPTNNFGVGTMCAKKWVPDGIMLADMVTYYGLNRNDASSESWKTINGYAFYGNDGPQIKMNDTLRNILGLQMLLPKILKVLSIDLGFEKEKNKSVTVTIDSAMKRFLQFGKWKAMIDKLPKTDPVSKAYDAKKILIATSDFVLLNYSVDINREDSFGIKLGLKIDSLINIGKFTFDKDSLGLVISHNQTGGYSIRSNKPLVIGVIVKKRRDVEVESLQEGFQYWDNVSADKIKDVTVKLIK